MAHARQGVERSGGGREGICRSSLDVEVEPRNPTQSEEYRGRLQGVLYSTRGAQTSKTGSGGDLSIKSRRP
eukprot:3548838-Pyramimonas_sp.AAC.3